MLSIYLTVIAMKREFTTKRKKERGVSPIIGVILMVAITVVLAVSLYMTLPKTAQEMKNNQLVTLTPEKQEGNNWTLTVVCNSPINPVNVKYAFLYKNGTVAVSGAQFPTNDSYEDSNGVTWIDMNKDGALSTNDIIKINGDRAGITPGSTFRITAGAVGQCELPY